MCPLLVPDIFVSMLVQLALVSAACNVLVSTGVRGPYHLQLIQQQASVVPSWSCVFMLHTESESHGATAAMVNTDITSHICVSGWSPVSALVWTNVSDSLRTNLSHSLVSVQLPSLSTTTNFLGFHWSRVGPGPLGRMVGSCDVSRGQ